MLVKHSIIIQHCRMARKYVKVDQRLTILEKASCEGSIECFKNDIIEYLLGLDGNRIQIDPIMIDNQPEITWVMRPFIIDYLVELHNFFKLDDETLFLACSISDKYCSKRIVYKKHYQLLIITSLWIAAKFKDVKTRIPTLKELCFVCHRTYEPNVFLQMERHILKTLEWSIGNIVTTSDMLQLMISSSSDDLIPKDFNFLNLASFFCDVSLYRRSYLSYSSLTKAIAALLITSRILGHDDFPDFLVQLMTFSLEKNDFCLNDPEFYKQACDDIHENEYRYNDDIKRLHQLNELSSIICSQNINDIRNCFYLFLKDVFHENSQNNGERISNLLLRKHSVGSLLESYKSQNCAAYNNLCFMKDALEHSDLDSDVFQSHFKDSVFTYIDRLAGFKTTEEKLKRLSLPFIYENMLLTSPLTPLSSLPVSRENDISKINVPNTMPLAQFNPSMLCSTTNCDATFTPLASYYPTQFNSYPPTPLSANSCFSARPKLGSIGSSSSSVSFSANSMVSPAGLLKKSYRSNSRNSPSRFRPVLSRKSSTQSDIYELISK